MNVQRLAFIVFHACPLAAPGQGKSGGMNVYVRELARSMGDLSVNVDIFTRDHAGASRPIEEISSNVRVVHLPGGPADAPMDTYYSHLPEFLDALTDFQRVNSLDYQLAHSHYWLSGWAGQAFAKERQIPHVMTFHTLALIKMQSRAGEVEPEERSQNER